MDKTVYTIKNKENHKIVIQPSCTRTGIFFLQYFAGDKMFKTEGTVKCMSDFCKNIMSANGEPELFGDLSHDCGENVLGV